MLLRLLAFAYLAGGVLAFLAMFSTSITPDLRVIFGGAAFGGVLGFAVLSALGQIVDSLSDIAANTRKK